MYIMFFFLIEFYCSNKREKKKYKIYLYKTNNELYLKNNNKKFKKINTMKKLNYDMIRKHSHEAEEDASPSTGI